MADDNDENKNKINSDIDVIWWFLGAVAGMVLAVKYFLSLGVSRDAELPWSQGVLMLACLFGPGFFLGLIADQFRKEVERGRMPWEVYWSVLSGIAASIFAFLGVTGIDDILRAWDVLYPSEGTP
ncbi:hypothetical protein SAMN02982929_04109 [Saccharopolyspora kobensis]|uniref:Uncharacterized protein n=1 Tax=Saccharopolyspora kobensis TaxID=146035 RepID=A0A1H6DDD4_9PSEU|nr:hypothetical protein [Saccharopolyspora kobensis]SEG82496.1 hypothetical protein SAMN02982929_04109 [Saccharopolyspora kobensis]SFE24748.1 hypothetical protein SAMN05216506_11026 [Saccharopolyspora kobensis]